MFFLDFFSSVSFVFEIFALILSFYLKNTRIFFLSLFLIQARGIYLYTSIFQAHLFVSLFMPLVFFIFCLKKHTKLIFQKQNISSILVLAFIEILSFFVTKNTNFNSAILEFHLFTLFFFKPINNIGFIFFIFTLAILLLQAYKIKEIYLPFAFFGAYFCFLFEYNFSFFEFASLIFIVKLLYDVYKIAFFDSNTKLANEKKLHHFVKGKEGYYAALLHFKELEQAQERYAKIILKHIAKILKRLKAKIFIVNDDFIIIFNDKDTALKHLGYLESLLKNTEFCIENEKFKLEFQIVVEKSTADIEHTLQSLKRKLF